MSVQAKIGVDTGSGLKMVQFENPTNIGMVSMHVSRQNCNVLLFDPEYAIAMNLRKLSNVDDFWPFWDCFEMFP